MGRRSGTLEVTADLAFEVDVPGRSPLHGTLTGSGRHLQLRVDDPAAFGGRGDSAAVRGMAAALAARGLRVTVVAGEQPFLAPNEAVLPDATLAPPATLTPLAPTFLRRPRPAVTTTHDPRGGGNPRLVLAPRSDPWPGDEQPVFRLRDGVSTIGSGPDCDIRLPGLLPVHAEVRHDAADEFVVGGWTLTFARDEYADHGRPYGGRIGGELGRQRPQPSREALRTQRATGPSS